MVKRERQGDRSIRLVVRKQVADQRSGITNQRETTLAWSRSSGKPLHNAIVWGDMRTSAVVRQLEQKLEEEGIDIDEDDEKPPNGTQSMGTGTAEAAFADTGDVVGDGIMGAVGRVMEGLGLAGRGKEGISKKRRKGREGLMDM